MTMELWRRRALAIAMSCRWPCEKLTPPADTFVSKETVVRSFPGSAAMTVVVVDSAAVTAAAVSDDADALTFSPVSG